MIIKQTAELLSHHFVCTFRLTRCKGDDQYVDINSKPTRFTGDADAIGSSDELHGLLINPHQSDGVDEG